MKTILVPTQSIAAMKSALEVAVLLAQRTGAYIEGFPLRIAIPPYDAARAEGCDLLIKGAFTRNRLRQMIFGGATRSSASCLGAAGASEPRQPAGHSVVS
jgi:hypothetical protein